MKDPVVFANQLLMLAIMTVGVVVVFKFRHRVLFLLTGSDRVHLDINGTLWFVFCRCGNSCNGDWTKYVSLVLCCCCESLRGRNLKRILGQALGLVPVPVRITNIVVGDLPTYYEGDFYVSIEAGAGPVHVTSVQTDSDPKVVQFPDPMIIRVRYSMTQQPIRFSVKRLLALGSEELCEVYLHPMQLGSWVFQQKPPMRFKMEPMNRGESFAFPPWILMELTSEPEWGSPWGFEVRLEEFHTQTRVFSTSAKDFKARYTLLTNHGMAAEEPDEDAVGEIDRVRRNKGACLGQMTFLLLLAILSFFGARYYTFSCYEEYAKVTVLQRFDVEFPVDRKKSDHILGMCGLQGDHMIGLVTDSWQRAGTAVMRHVSRVAPLGALAANASRVKASRRSARAKCAPAYEDVLAVCKELPFGCPCPGIPYNVLGMVKFSIPCVGNSCQAARRLKDFDLAFLEGLACWVVAFVVLKCAYEFHLRHLQSKLFDP
mmetsp:Transcript_112115/g.361990  ORF Transcript_112115/g.361990 Transcript_112115/m.361990 type:complete len:485 (+) Transcript_112115:135-1589(+)